MEGSGSAIENARFRGSISQQRATSLFYEKDDLTVDLPNPHKQDIGVGLLKKILKQAEVSREEWFSAE